MANKNTSVYEILEVSPNASYSEIQAAHQRLTQKLQSEYTGQNREDIDFRQRLIDVAFQSLSYDVKKAQQNALITVSAPPDIVAPPINLDALSLKADAMALKADAMSLKADAASIRAEIMSLRTGALISAATATEDSHPSHWKMFFSAFTSLSSPFKRLLMLFGGFVATAMVLQVVFALSANRQITHTTTNEDTQLAEKVYLQEYYQKHGVRVGSRAEGELLDAENRRKESEQRAAEFEKQRQEDEYRRFTEESKRIGNQVSNDLRRAEEATRQEEARQKQQELQRLEQQRRAIEEAERAETERARKKLGLSSTKEPTEPPTYYRDPPSEDPDQ